MKTLEIEHLSKQFLPAVRPAVHDISFQLEQGEILALVGPSGCGKTTTLRLVAGLERPDGGVIRLNGQLVASQTTFLPPEKRGLGMVFQDYALFPHLKVSDNVAFGLNGRKPAEVRAVVTEMLAMVGLEHKAQHYPHTLSGGERQRVALARALAPGPVLVLLDEPFSSLDADLRLEVREQVRGILKSRQATAIFVTHDQEEALYMGDRLAVFQQGCLEQIGPPEQIFHAAATRFVAKFMGSSDFLAGQAASGRVLTEIGRLPQPTGLPAATPVEVALRADDVDFRLDEAGNSTITQRFFRGAFNIYQLRLDSGQVVHALKAHTEILPVGVRAHTYIHAEHPLGIFYEGLAVCPPKPI